MKNSTISTFIFKTSFFFIIFIIFIIPSNNFIFSKT